MEKSITLILDKDKVTHLPMAQLFVVCDISPSDYSQILGLRSLSALPAACCCIVGVFVLNRAAE